LKVIEFLKKKYRLDINFIQGLFYFISELSINIPEHANADNAFSGNFLLFSGQEIFLKEQDKEIFSFVSSKLNGTAINCLIPLRKKKIDIYKFIE